MPAQERDIVVMGRFGSTIQPFGNLGLGSFGAFYVAGGLTLQQTMGTDTAAGVLGAADNRPAIKTQGTNAKQLATVMAAMDNAVNDPQLSASLADMKIKNMTIKVTVTDIVPGDFASNQVAAVRIPLVAGSDGEGPAPDTFAQGREVENIVIGARLATGSGNFAHRLAHELTHLIKNENGSLLTEAQVQQRDGQTYNRLFGQFSESDYENSTDVIPIVLSSDGTHSFSGTEGNNLFDEAQYGEWSRVYTGAGNDIIVSGDYADGHHITGGGRKVIFDSGVVSAWDSVIFYSIASAAEMMVSRVGYDLYLTSVYSGVAPTNDLNSVIIKDFFVYPSGTVEFAVFPSGEVVALSDYDGMSMAAASENMSYDPFASISAVTWQLDSDIAESAGFTSYASIPLLDFGDVVANPIERLQTAGDDAAKIADVLFGGIQSTTPSPVSAYPHDFEPVPAVSSTFTRWSLEGNYAVLP